MTAGGCAHAHVRCIQFSWLGWDFLVDGLFFMFHFEVVLHTFYADSLDGIVSFSVFFVVMLTWPFPCEMVRSFSFIEIEKRKSTTKTTTLTSLEHWNTSVDCVLRTLTSAGYFETEYIIAVYVHRAHTHTHTHARTYAHFWMNEKTMVEIY